MAFTIAEKMQIAMLRDLAKPPNSRELDFDFIMRAVINDDEWALDWKYSGLNLQVETPSNVSLVVEILDMWDRLEVGFDNLGEEDKDRLRGSPYDIGTPKFCGFDGNNESELRHIADLLISDLGRWSRFKDRDLNSHIPSIDLYRRMLSAWRPLWDKKVRSGSHTSTVYNLSADDIIAVMRERIYPGYRQMQPDGDWTFDRTKLASK